MLKRKWIFLFCSIFLLTGCLSPASTGPNLATLHPDCREKGNIQHLSIESPTQGYPYDFTLYLPPCYNPTPGSDSAYPVLYLVPGRGSGPDAWFNAGAADVADELILKGEISPFLIVSTQNIDGDMFAETILNDLVPYIEANYPIHPNRKYHAVAGGSLGGIASYRMAFRFPEKFSSAALFGSGVIHGEERQVDSWLNALSTENSLRVFMDCGTEDPLMLERAEALASMLYEKKVDHILHIGEGGHNYTYWVSNFPQYLRWLAEGWE